MRKIFIFACFLITAFLSADGVQPNGTGTETDPYLISSLNNLLWLSTTPDVWDDNAYFIQTADIDASDTENWNGGEGFSPIGTNDSPFSGTYDGFNYCVDNLFLRTFFLSTSNSVVTNLNFTDLSLTPGYDLAPLIKYCNDTLVDNCHVSLLSDEVFEAEYAGSCLILECTNSVIRDCSASGSLVVTEDDWYDQSDATGAGLIVLCHQSTVVNSTFSGELTTDWDQTGINGGLVFESIDSFFENCHTSGLINPGKSFCFFSSESTFNNCTSSADIYMYGTSQYYGFEYPNNTVSNAYYDYNSVLINGEAMFTQYGIPSDLYNSWLENDQNFPDLSTFLAVDGVGNYQINSYVDLQKLMVYGNQDEQYSFILTADIDLTDANTFFINRFTGTFDGNEHQLMNLNTSDNSGSNILFRYIEDADICNLEISNFFNNYQSTGLLASTIDNSSLTNITVTNSVFRGYRAGGIAGIVTNSQFENVSLSQCSVSGYYGVGGLAGLATASSFSNCSVTGEIEANTRTEYIHNDYFTYDGHKAGGLFGECIDSSIENCYSNADVRGATQCGGLIGNAINNVLIDSYFIGSVEGVQLVGGLIGKCTENSTISNCYTTSMVRGVILNHDSLEYFLNIGLGGLIGEATISTIFNSYCIGSLTFERMDYGDRIGGFIGNNSMSNILNSYCSNIFVLGEVYETYALGSFAGYNSGSIIDCIWNTDSSILTEGCGLIESSPIIELYAYDTDEMQDLNTYIGIGWDFLGETANGAEDIWTINPDLNSGYPYLVALEQSVGNEEEAISTPELQTKLNNNYPNPFNPETTISFCVKKNDVATLKIFNIRGQVVKSYPQFTPGEHKVIWKGFDKNKKPVASGVYFYRLESKTGSQTKKMILMK